MGEGRAALPTVNDGCYAETMARVFEAGDESSEPILAGIESVIEMAERDPNAALEVLWRLQGDRQTLESMEEAIGGEHAQAVLRLGAAIQVVRAELSSPSPEPRRCLAEVLGWLYDADRGAV